MMSIAATNSKKVYAATESSGFFRADRAWGHLEMLGRPRLVGTLNERRTSRALRRQFEALGLQCRRERFRVPHLAREIAVFLMFVGCATLVLGGLRLAPAWPLASAALWLTAALLVNAPWRIASKIQSGWPGQVTTENLIAAHPQMAARKAPARVVFMAHYDSKSQWLPTGVRVGLVFAVTGLCLTLAVSGLILGLAADSVPAIAFSILPLACLVLGMLVTLAVNRTGNRSPGALDNASGLAVLLELARTWRPSVDALAEVYWVATGAEETGLDGARELLRRHEAWWREKPTLLINLDSVGAGPTLYLAGEPNSLQLAERTAADLDLSSTRLRILGASMDHQPFADRGLCALTILGDVVGRSMAMHGHRDTLAIVDRDSLHRAGTLAAQIAWNWADRYQSPAASTTADAAGHTVVEKLGARLTFS